MMKTLKRRTAVLIVALPVVVAAYAGVAISQGTESPQPAEPLMRQKAEGADPQVREAFAVVRRERQKHDAMPAVLAAAVDDGAQTIGGANVRLARRAHAIKDAQAYVVPGNGSVCLAVDRGPAAGTSVTCNVLPAVRERGAVTTEAASPIGTDRRVHALVPDGVEFVRFRTAANRTLDVDVVNNVVIADVPADTVEMEYHGSLSARIEIPRPAP